MGKCSTARDANGYFDEFQLDMNSGVTEFLIMGTMLQQLIDDQLKKWRRE